MNKLLLSFLLVVFVVQYGTAQKKKAWVKAADHAFSVEEDYYKAFKYYDAALKYKESEDYFRLLFHKAESARLIGAPLDARASYEKILAEAPEDTLSKSPYRDTWARLGEVQLSLAYNAGNFSPASYEVAAQSFAKSDDNAYGTGTVAEAVARGEAVIEFVNGNQTALVNESIQLEQSTFEANYPDFGLAPWPWAPPEEVAPGRSDRFYPQFYLSGKEGKYYASPSGNLSGCMRTYLGNTAINQERSRVYFSACKADSDGFSTSCNIYYQNLDAQGLPTGDRMELSALKTSSETVIQIQPVISWDATNQREVLYFVSNRPGGRGGMDIWKSEYDQENNRFSSPTNMPLINTPGDEITPFYQSEVLYFSSNGQADRYGGFDLFSWNASWEAAENMGQKINSSADDFGYSRNVTGDRAFFTSNRQSIFLSNEELATSCGTPDVVACCCLDTYTYEVPPCYLEITTVANCDCPDTDGCEPLPGVEVRLLDITGGDSYADNEGVGPTSIRENVYLFNDRFRSGRKYQVVGRVENNGSMLEVFSKTFDFTDGADPCADGPVKDTLPFKCDDPKLTVQVYESSYNGVPVRNARVAILDITNQAPNVSSNASGTSDRSDMPCAEGYDLYEPLPGAIAIEAFSPHPVILEHTYVVTVTSDRQDLLPKRDTITIASADFACGFDCNKDLQVILDPKEEMSTPDTLQLFFENALPRWAGYPGGNRDISGQSYRESLQDYKRLQDTYMKQFTEDSELDQNQRLELGVFFDNELVTSEILLENFVEDVKKILCQGIPVTVEALGCTSPKFKDPGDTRQVNYNSSLANRRVESAQQDLRALGLTEGSDEWGDLYQFKQVKRACKDLTAGGAQDLEVINQMRGFSRTELGNQNNPKLSHYSIDASKFRRVDLYVVIRSDTPSQSP